jgi:hypothetical protein
MASKPSRFKAKLWRVPGPDGWFFVTVPKKFAFPVTGHFGRTPVRARVDGGREWSTSTWRDRKHGALLAVPKRVRGDKKVGDVVTVELVFDAERAPG